MTINELKAVLDRLSEQGHGNDVILFDSCAQNFSVHMIKISDAYYEEAENSPNGEGFLGLHFEFNGNVKRSFGFTDEEIENQAEKLLKESGYFPTLEEVVVNILKWMYLKGYRDAENKF